MENTSCDSVIELGSGDGKNLFGLPRSIVILNLLD